MKIIFVWFAFEQLKIHISPAMPFKYSLFCINHIVVVVVALGYFVIILFTPLVLGWLPIPEMVGTITKV